jgi:hypothetical protein
MTEGQYQLLAIYRCADGRCGVPVRAEQISAVCATAAGTAPHDDGAMWAELAKLELFKLLCILTAGAAELTEAGREYVTTSLCSTGVPLPLTAAGTTRSMENERTRPPGTVDGSEGVGKTDL